MGDFNLPEIQWIDGSGFCNRDSPFLSAFADISLCQTISQPTCFREGQVSNILDLVILSNLDLLIKNVITTPVGNSDHVLIISELCLPTIQPSSKQRKYVNYKIVSEKLAKVNWKKLITDDIEESWSNVKMEILNVEKSCTRIFQVKQAKSLPFLTTKISKLINRKHRAWNRYRKYKTTENYLVFKSFCN